MILGSSIVEYISEKYLYLILGTISILLAFYSFLKPDLGLSSGNKKLNFVHKIRFLIFIFLIGILNGSISSGTGLLVTILLIKTFEMDFLRAISMTFFTVGIFLEFCRSNFFVKNRIGSFKYIDSVNNWFLYRRIFRGSPVKIKWEYSN